MRTPSRVDRDISVTLLAAVTPVLTYGVLTGSDAIEPETVVGVEGGYRTLLTSSLYVDVTAFRTRYAGLVDVGSGPIETRVTDGVAYRAIVLPWINGNDADTTGVEVTPDWQVTPRLRLRGSYSLVDIDVEARPENTRQLTRGSLEASTPRHRVSLQALLTVGRWQVDPVYRYVSSRLGIDSYHTADLHVRVPITPAVDLTLVGQNLLQAEHEEWLRDPGPAVAIRRAAYVGITWRHGGRASSAPSRR
jgi:iron complex outermembrane receptor protein